MHINSASSGVAFSCAKFSQWR